MRTPIEPIRPDGCISDLRFDAWLSGELRSEHVEPLSRHVSECPRCGARHATLVRERERFLRTHAPPMPVPPRRTAPALRRSIALSAAALSAAAALALMVQREDASSGGERAKGGERIGVFIKHGEQVRRGYDGDTVQPGDRLRLTYTSDRESYLALLGRDETGRVDIYYPAGTHAVRVAAGRGQPLPLSVELDATPGRERFFLVFCRGRFKLAPLSAELARSGDIRVPQDCSYAALSLVKGAP